MSGLFQPLKLQIMKPIKIDKSEFEAWAKDTPVMYASCSVSRGEFNALLRFWAFVDGGGYKVTFGNKTLYEGGSFSTAAAEFNAKS